MGARMFYAAGRQWGRKRAMSEPPQEATGGPSGDEGADALAEQKRRIGFVERRLDWLSRRVERLEESVKADAIAPLDPPPNGGGR